MGYARVFYSTRHVADWLGISPRTLGGYRIMGKTVEQPVAARCLEVLLRATP